MEAEVVVEAEEEAELALEYPFSQPTREMSENKEHYLKSLKETAPKQKNSSRIYGATFT